MAALLEGYVAKLEGWAKWIKDGWPLPGSLRIYVRAKTAQWVLIRTSLINNTINLIIKE